MKLLFILASIMILSVIGIQYSFAENQSILSPYKQLQSGVLYNDIQCKDGHDLIVRPFSDSPSCVRPQTAEKLAQRLDFVIKIDSSSIPNIPSPIVDSVLSSVSGSGIYPGINTITISNVPTLGETAVISFHGEIWENIPSLGEEPIIRTYSKDNDYGQTIAVGVGLEVLDEQATIVQPATPNCGKLCSHLYNIPYPVLQGDEKITDFTVTVKAIETGVWNINGGGGGFTEGNGYLKITVGETNSFLGGNAYPYGHISMSMIMIDANGNPIYSALDAETFSALSEQNLEQKHFFTSKSDAEMQQLTERLLQIPYFQELFANFTG